MLTNSFFRTAAVIAVLVMIAYILLSSNYPQMDTTQFCCPPVALFVLSGIFAGLHFVSLAMKGKQ